MNLRSIKEEFKNYYLDELIKKGQDISLYDDENASISIFKHKDEFKDFLKENYGADSEILSKSLSDIMKMEVEDGKLVDNDEESDDDSDLMRELLNEVLSDENVKNALDIDKSDDLDSEEIGVFLRNIQGTSDENKTDDELTFDDLAVGVEDIYNGEYQKRDVVLDDEELKGEDATQALLDEMYKNEKVFEELDIDKDGTLSLEEQEKFEQYIKAYDGYSDEISQNDIKSAYYDILEGDFSYDNKLDFDNTKQEVVDKTEDKKTYSADSSLNAISPKNTYGSARSSKTATVQEKTIDNMTLDELKNEKTKQSSEVQEAQDNVNKIYSGENEALKEAQENLDNAKEEYDKALESEIEKNPELKQLFISLKDTISQIDSTQKSINEVELEISATQNELTQQNATLSADKSNLQALESSKSALESQKTDDPEQQAKIDEKITSLESQIEEANKKVQQDEEKIKQTKEKLSELETGDNGLEKLNEKLEELEKTKTELEENIESLISKSTKQAQQNYDNAKENYEKIKESELKNAQEILETKQKELDKINEKINEKEASKIQSQNKVGTYDFDFETNLTSNQQADLDKFKANYEANMDKYQKVEDATGVPAELIAAIHWRESTGNFNTYLHNGQPLGQVTTLVPKGIYFEDWTEAAIDAISSHNPEIIDENDVTTLYEYAERYNGTGYRKRGVNSPYVWSGTTNYSSGKYVKDGVYDPSAVDKQLGVAVMLQAIC